MMNLSSQIASKKQTSKISIALAFQKVMKSHGYYLDIDKVIPVMVYEKVSAIEMMLMRHEGDKSKITSNFIDLIYSDFLREISNLSISSDEINHSTL